jgi:ubiquinol-cytochrome c reductase cytochrome c subunit
MAHMNLPARIVSLALATAAAVLLTSHGATAQTTPAAAPAALPAGADVARGKAAFMRYGCYECHGTVAQGNYMGIPHLAPHALPYAAINAYIRKPAGQMPSYSVAILPDKDVADIAAFLASIPVGKKPADIPLLNSTTTTPK